MKLMFLVVAILAATFVVDAKKCRRRCPKILRKVCGSDGETYNNRCLLRLAACQADKPITVVSCNPGPKPCNEICTKILLPVCGSDGKMYNNLCLLRLASCQADKPITKVPCNPGPKPCPKICPRIILPVCGSDGKKYNNLCLLQVEACETDKPITKVPCDDDNDDTPNCVIPCPRNLNPVCGSDGKTYSNKCLMKVASCRSQKAIIVIRRGTCPADDVKRCNMPIPKIYRPVCGSDRKKYNNFRLMVKQACIEKSAIVFVRRLTKKGKPCTECNTKCGKKLSPICGSDGNTYQNRCLMKAKSCEEQTAIIKVYDGKCKK